MQTTKKIIANNKKAAFNYFLENKIMDCDYESIREEKSQVFMNIIQKVKTLEITEWSLPIIQYCIQTKTPFVIVTNSTQEQLAFYLEKFPILKKCQKYYTRESVIYKKPHPECYEKVLHDFPSATRPIGFEDSITGIHALCQVPKIQPVFVNNKSYVYYAYIIVNYPVMNIYL